MDLEGWLKELRVPREAYRVVSLLPLVYVAWADGRIQKSERDVILHIARERGMLDHGGEDALSRWLSRSPSKQQLQADLAALNELARRTIVSALDLRNATQWRAALRSWAGRAEQPGRQPVSPVA